MNRVGPVAGADARRAARGSGGFVAADEGRGDRRRRRDHRQRLRSRLRQERRNHPFLEVPRDRARRQRPGAAPMKCGISIGVTPNGLSPWTNI